MFERGELVFGKLKSYPWWPAMILSADDCCRKGKDIWIFWFGDHKFSQINQVKDIAKFSNSFETCKNTKGNSFEKALQEALNVLALINDVAYPDFKSLLSWATSECRLTTSKILYKWVKPEVPEIVKTTVSKLVKASKRKRAHSISESSDSDEYDDAVSDVKQGLKKLEDICIGCCKKEAKGVFPHPLFIGSICVKCEPSIKKACRASVSEMKEICIVCGQRGNLVYCCNSLCKRAYCQMCIEYLVSESAFKVIVSNDIWFCYLCKMDPGKHCLIKRREIYQAETSSELQIFSANISVLSFNYAGLHVLEDQHFCIGHYEINPKLASDTYSKNYKDFSAKEIYDLSPTLIIGSFFKPKELSDRKEGVELLFISFFRFFYRLATSKLKSDKVFFIYSVNSEILDDNISSRIMRFLMVKPSTVRFGNRKFAVWNNISENDFILEEPLKDDMNDEYLEKQILHIFLKKIRKYFPHKFY